MKRPFGTKNVCEEADRFRILVQFFSSLSIQENHTAAPAYQTVVLRFHGCQVTINYGAALVFSNRAAIKHWQKLACTLSKFVASLPHCRDCKNRDFKITFVELSYVVCFQWSTLFPGYSLYFEKVPWLRSFLYGPRCARSVLSRPRADIRPVRPSRLVNKIYPLILHFGCPFSISSSFIGFTSLRSLWSPAFCRVPSDSFFVR